jgi:hypothetical protein
VKLGCNTHVTLNFKPGPNTMHMMHIRLCQLQDLMERWKLITHDMFSNHSSNIRVEIIVHTKMVINDRRLCRELDLLWIGSLKNALGGPFGIKSCALDKFLY